MLVSIIIPCYNCENTIKRAIESVLNQSYKNFELILINDGSLDNTQTICESFSESDTRINSFTIANQGPSYARNYGVNKAKGDYILFIDADDYIEENTIKDLVDIAYTNDFEIIFYGYTYEKYQKGKVVKNINISHSKKLITNNEEFKFIFNTLSDKGYLYQVWNKMYKKSFLNQCNAKFPIGITVSEDFSFNLSLYQKLNKAYISPNCYYHYISNNCGSLTTTFSSTKFEQIIEFYKKNRQLIESWNKSYLSIYDNHFLLDISVCVNNLFNKDCNYTFAEKIHYIKNIFDKTYTLVVQIPAVGLRSKIVKIMIRYKMTYLFYIVGKLSRIKYRKDER